MPRKGIATRPITQVEPDGFTHGNEKLQEWRGGYVEPGTQLGYIEGGTQFLDHCASVDATGMVSTVSSCPE